MALSLVQPENTRRLVVGFDMGGRGRRKKRDAQAPCQGRRRKERGGKKNGRDTDVDHMEQEESPYELKNIKKRYWRFLSLQEGEGGKEEGGLGMTSW